MTETDFFRLIDNPGSTGLGTAYNEFTTTVVSLCKERESVCRTVFALSYAETELQYHDAMQETDSSRSMYVRKALSFVRKMLKYYQVGLYRGGAFDGGEKTNQRQDEAAAMQWTGSTAELTAVVKEVKVRIVLRLFRCSCTHSSHQTAHHISLTTNWKSCIINNIINCYCKKIITIL